METVYITTNRFPSGDAGAVRDEAIIRLVSSIKGMPLVIGLGTSTAFQLREYNDIPYYSMRGTGKSLLSRVVDRLLFFYRIKEVIATKKPDYLVVSSSSGRLLKIIKKYAENNNIRLVFNSVEWYSPDEFKLRHFSPVYIDNDVMNRKILDKKVYVIAISRYLANYYNEKGINNSYIPAIMDIEKMNYDVERHNNKLVFVYAGTPGKKDYISNIIAAFAGLEPEEKEKIEFKIIGVTKERLIKECEVSNAHLAGAESCIKIYGRLNHDETVRQLLMADFSVFLRDSDKRYAKAGFPTKFVESMGVGTPVICNLSSDLEDFLYSGHNGYISPTADSEDLKNCIRKALSISDERLKRMKRDARRTAEKHFDYRIYRNQLEKLL